MRLPTPLRILWDAWMAFSRVFGRVMSTIILTVFWIIGIGIYAVIMKVISLVRGKKKPDSYWIESQHQTRESMLQQF